MSNEQQLINLTDARQLFETQTGGDREFYLELVDIQLQEGEKLIGQMQQSLVANDAKTFRRVAHTMKGAGRTFGLPLLTQAAYALEKDSIDSIPENAEPRAHELITIYQQSMEALTNFSKQL